MASRNLTKDFVGLRRGEKANQHLNLDNGSENSDNGLLGHSAEATDFQAAHRVVQPEWLDRIDAIEANAGKIEMKMKELTALHTKRLMVNFETEESKHEREVDTKTREITLLFKDAENLLKLFQKESDIKGASGPEKTIRTNVQHSLAKKLQGLNMAFRSTQKEYLSRLQRQTSGVQEEDPDLFEDQGLKQEHLFAMERADAEVKERGVEIKKIAQSIEELAGIFKELAVLVIDQGTILDRIDFNMESAVGNASEGMVQLKKAEDHQKNALPMRCIIVLVVLIAIMLIVLVVKNTPKSK